MPRFRRIPEKAGWVRNPPKARLVAALRWTLGW